MQPQRLMVRGPPNYPLVAGVGFEPTIYWLWASWDNHFSNLRYYIFLSFIYILYNTLEEKCKCFWLFYVEKLCFGYCQTRFLFFFSPFLIYNIIINSKAGKMQVFWTKIWSKFVKKLTKGGKKLATNSHPISYSPHFSPQFPTIWSFYDISYTPLYFYHFCRS